MPRILDTLLYKLGTAHGCFPVFTGGIHSVFAWNVSMMPLSQQFRATTVHKFSPLIQ